MRLNLLTFSNLNSSCMFSWWLFSDAFLYLGIGLLLMFRNMALDKKILEPYLAGESWSKKRQWTGLKRGWILSSSTYLQRNWIKTLLRFLLVKSQDISRQTIKIISQLLDLVYPKNSEPASNDYNIDLSLLYVNKYIVTGSNNYQDLKIHGWIFARYRD